MKISIISTTYNRKDLLLQTIESVQKSILDPYSDVEFEHIIYDDASTDDTHEIFKNQTWKNVIYIRGEVNKGQSFGQNQALKKATGDYIFLIDSDDILLQRTLYHFAEQAKRYPEVSWFISDFIRVDNDLRYIIGQDYYTWDFKNVDEMITAILKGEHFLQSSIFVKRELFFEAGLFDPDWVMAQDIDMFIRFLFHDHMPHFCRFISHLHRVHHNNISAGITLKEHMTDVEKLKTKYKAEITKRGITLA